MTPAVAATLVCVTVSRLTSAPSVMASASVKVFSPAMDCAPVIFTFCASSVSTYDLRTASFAATGSVPGSTGMEPKVLTPLIV